MKNKILQRSAHGTKLRFPGYNKAWKTAQLGDVCKIVSERLDPKNDSSVRCIELEHIEACTGRLLGTTTTAEIVSLKAVFRPGDVLFGKLRPYLKKFYMPSFTGVCSTEIWVLRPTNCVIDAAFLFCIIQSSLVQRSANATFGTKMPRADWDVVSATPIRFPELDEQSRISGLHQSINQTTEYLDRLIAAKREQKRGLMQQLLTGKLRFPGFTEPWQKSRIGELLEEVARPVTWSDNCIYRLVSVRRRNGGLFLREMLAGSEIASKSLYTARTGDLLISKMQVVHGAIAIVPEALDGTHISGMYLCLKARSTAKIETKFINLIACLPLMRRLTISCAHGVHIEKMTFDSKKFMDLQLYVPSSIEEQRKVIKVFDLLETEIELLEQQRAAFAAQRRGLMEKLLSGEIDIQNPKETAA